MVRKNLLDRWDIENAVTKGTKGDGRVADLRVVGERDFQDGDIGDDWSGDCGDEE